jgi:predicted nicotinamide N-methyase
LCINDHTFKILEVTNFDELYDVLAKDEVDSQKNLEDLIPYWTELWPSAIALSSYLVEHVDLVKNKRILEIGCGLGLPSIVASTLMANEIVASDIIPEALEFSKRNAKLNSSSNLSFTLLDWTQSLFRLAKDFDIILGSDIIYEKRFVNAVIAVLDSLSREGAKTTILLTEPNRNITNDFTDTIKKIKNVSHSMEVKEVWNRGVNFKINVHHISLG